MDGKIKREAVIILITLVVLSYFHSAADLLSEPPQWEINTRNVSSTSNSTGRRILFDERGLEYHDEYLQYWYSIRSTEYIGYSHIAEKLKERGHKVYHHDRGDITLEKLRSFDVLVLNRSPQYTSEEVSAIVSFVEKGGNLFCLGNPYQWEKLESVSSKFSVHYPQKDIELADLVNNYKNNNKIPRILLFYSHPITEGVLQACLGWGTYIESGSKGEVLAKSSASSFADEAPHNSRRDLEEEQGSFTVLLATQKGKGRVVFTGDETFMRNDFITYLDNEKLALNIFEWLSETVPVFDLDNDRFPYPRDCNDDDPEVHPGAKEICDGKDNDCDGEKDEGFDNDRDGYTTCGGDCDDNDFHVHPGASEPCGRDYNCDGEVTVCTGNLKIITSSEEKEVIAKVYLDGVYKGETDSEGVLFIFDLETNNKYTVRVEKEGYHPGEKTVTVAENSTTECRVDMEKEFDFGSIAVVGLGVCGLILAIFVVRFRKLKREERLELHPEKALGVEEEKTEIGEEKVGEKRAEKLEEKGEEEKTEILREEKVKEKIEEGKTELKRIVEEKEVKKVEKKEKKLKEDKIKKEKKIKEGKEAKKVKEELPKTIKCPFCNHEIQKEWVSCPHCGTKLKDDTRIY